MEGFSDKSRPRTTECRNKKRNTFESANALYEGRELILNSFKSRIFPIIPTWGKGCPTDLACLAKVFHRTRLKILTPKQMLQRLPITLAQLKAGNTYENLLNEIGQLIFSLHRAKWTTEKVYDNTMNSIKV